QVARAEHPPRGDGGQGGERVVDVAAVLRPAHQLARLWPVHDGVVVEQLIHDVDVARIDAVDQAADDRLILPGFRHGTLLFSVGTGLRFPGRIHHARAEVTRSLRGPG